jgi:hypothetical protein
MKRASRKSGAREKQPIATIARASDATSTAPGHAAARTGTSLQKEQRQPAKQPTRTEETKNKAITTLRKSDKQEAATRSEKHTARDTDEKEAAASQRSDKHNARSDEHCNTANCDVKVR